MIDGIMKQFVYTVAIILLLTFPSLVQAQTASKSAEPATATAAAQQANTSAINLTLSPIFLTFNTTPGKPVEQEIRIRNNGTEIEYLEIELDKFGPEANSEDVVLADFTVEDEHKDWLTFSETQFIVNPGEWKTIRVTFAPPESAALNYFYAPIFRRQTRQAAQGGDTVFMGGPALLTLANVESPLSKKELQLGRFKIPRVFFEFLPVTFDVTLKNTGNSFIAPTGNIFIDGNGQKDIAILPLNKARGSILPQTDRTYTTEWTDGFPVYQPKMEKDAVVKDEKGEITYQLHWDFSQANKLRFGRYTAHLLAVYDNGERDVLIESQQSFWVIPWRMLLATLVIALFMLIGIWSTIRPFIRKMRKPPTVDPQPPVEQS